MLVTKNGIIKRTPLDAFDNCRKSGLIALTIREDDALVWAEYSAIACDLRSSIAFS